MKNVLVTGGKGQLASCIRDAIKDLKDFNFLFVDSDKLDITKENEVKDFFSTYQIEYCVNCAAYTAVDKAEAEPQMAKDVNEEGAKNLAKFCKDHRAILIQVSTDFVFDGQQSVPYKEEDVTNPLGIYGMTKLNGEKEAIMTKEHFVIRTSWLYSEHNHNFLKTMLKIGKEREELSVVYDQIGTPTYAGDLATAILKIITSKSSCYGVYHFSNEGVASWYDFAKAIFEEANNKIKVNPIKSEEYPTPAKRPHYSVLDKSKIKHKMDIEIPHWRDSLRRCLLKLK
ncbi:dTDP-4-dehydrorhamnose reductase [Aquimarina sp. SS2-1]|uniref:dTDP-4-dehydrorhamnose reductase n=1 Tax=Aquimarina besae TaxID=3342247 RepID=UPI00366D1218